MTLHVPPRGVPTAAPPSGDFYSDTLVRTEFPNTTAESFEGRSMVGSPIPATWDFRFWGSGADDPLVISANSDLGVGTRSDRQAITFVPPFVAQPWGMWAEAQIMQEGFDSDSLYIPLVVGADTDGGNAAYGIACRGQTAFATYVGAYRGGTLNAFEPRPTWGEGPWNLGVGSYVRLELTETELSYYANDILFQTWPTSDGGARLTGDGCGFWTTTTIYTAVWQNFRCGALPYVPR